MKRFFTSESVTEGHPDKICDQISDAILDAIFEQDPQGRVAAETLVTTGLVLVAGEISTTCYVDIPSLIRRVICDIGYTNSETGYDGNTCAVLTAVHEQSGDIAMGVDKALEYKEGALNDDSEAIGAGDQGIMFGYASDETPELMPLPIYLAHKLAFGLSEDRRAGVDWLRPDGKTQVSVLYEDLKPVAVTDVVVSTQHAASIKREEIIAYVKEKLAPRILGDWFAKDIRFHVNPTGSFVLGGPSADAGVTGRKIIVDSYGGAGRHGGGAFSGKDPSKVDRSAAYALRWVAKNVVAAGLATRCEVQVSYAIGRAHPISVHVDCYGTEKVPTSQIAAAIGQVFDLRPRAIIDQLDLLRPIYSQTTNYGHFGRELPEFTWERTDRAEQLKAAV